MLRALFKLSILLICSLSLSAESGLSQSHLASLTPAPSATDISADTTVKVEFDLPIVPESIDQSTIALKHDTGFAVNGSIGIAAANTLLFTPKEELKGGIYNVTIKTLQLQSKQKRISKPSTFLERLVHWICSIFYDDISKCPLCKYFCKMEPVKISTDTIEYTFSVRAEPEITEIYLHIPLTELSKGGITSATATAVYSDKKEKDVTEEVEWITADPSLLAIESNGTVTALKDGNTTVRAKFEEILSNPVTLHIYWEVDGHRLPPEPDPKINNATLLGVDSNNNGVRDDVERWIYETYDHPIERGIFMQSARAYQKVIVDPSKAHETVKYSDNALSCEFYWIYEKTPKPFDKYEYFSHRKNLKKIQFNTLKRYMAYEKYNAQFNGHVLDAPKPSKNKCEFDELGNLKTIK